MHHRLHGQQCIGSDVSSSRAVPAKPRPARSETNTGPTGLDVVNVTTVRSQTVEETRHISMKSHRGKFRDLVFTRKFSAFDRQNKDAVNSPFHGFYTFFWVAVALFIIKTAADNWKAHGSPLGTNDIMRTMFRRDVPMGAIFSLVTATVLVLLISDGGMCGLTGTSWIFQKLVFRGYIDWDREGWILQNVWQTTFIGGVVGLTLARDWPWTHTVFFVLHGLVMLMKQHSYAFYNGHLSSVWKQRSVLLSAIKQLERDYCNDRLGEECTASASSSSASALPSQPGWEPDAAVKRQPPKTEAASRGGMDVDQIVAVVNSGVRLDPDVATTFESILRQEAQALTEELIRNTTKPERAYPHNLTITNHYEYIVLPTVVYELEYPRSDSIDWFYILEKVAATVGILFVMNMLSQTFIYPVVMEAVSMSQMGLSVAQRFQAFPWMLSELIFPLMMEYLLTWYLIWETILNILAELTCFADRSFYDAWWNSVSWDQYARDWNRPVHSFLLRHVYHSSISSMKVGKHTATLITFFLSACVHELIMWCLFKKLRGYLLALQMFQLPLVQLSRTKYFKGHGTLGNLIFWLGLFIGPSLLCSLYLIL